MATFSNYVRKTVPFLAGTVQLDIRALSVTEAPDFKERVEAVNAQWQEASKRREGESEEDESYAERIRKALQIEQDFILGLLDRAMPTKSGPKPYYARMVEPLVNDDEEQTINNLRDLALRGGRKFRLAVLAEISSLAEVDPFLGNSSGSPSTSTTATGPNTSDSPVSITDVSACSPSSSTATAPISLVQSSTPAA